MECMRDEISNRLDALSAKVESVLAFVHDIERQRDDVAPAGSHMPMALHVKDGRRGVIVKRFLLTSPDEPVIVARCYNTQFPFSLGHLGVRQEVLAVGCNNGLIAFKPTGISIRDIMETIDAVCYATGAQLPIRVDLYNGIPIGYIGLLRAYIRNDDDGMLRAWEALPKEQQDRLLDQLDNPNAFFSRSVMSKTLYGVPWPH